jgi:hypothetical protein
MAGLQAGAPIYDDPSLEEMGETPEGYDAFIAALRVVGRDIAVQRGLSDAAEAVQHQCYLEIYGSLISDSVERYLDFLKSVYATQPIEPGAVSEIFTLAHTMPYSSNLVTGDVVGALERLSGLTVATAIRRPTVADAAGFLDVRGALRDARARADVAGLGKLVTHLSDFVLNIVAAKLVTMVGALGLSEMEPKTWRSAVYRTNELKRIVKLGVHDLAMDGPDVRANSVAMFRALAAGLAPVRNESGISLVLVA